MDMKSSSPKVIKQGALFLWLWRGYLRRHMWVLAIIVVLMMIEGSMVGGLAWMMQPLFDGVFVGGSKSQLWMVGGIVLGLFLIRGVLSVVHRVLMTKIAKQSVADLQNDLLRHLLQLDLSFFSRYAPGYLMERVNGDVQAVAGIWALLVRGAARDLIGLVSLFAVMLSIDWLWTVAALVGAPLLLFPSLVAQRYTRKQAVKAREVAANMATRLNEAFHGVGTIKLNGLERYYTDRYRALTKRQIEVEVKTLFGTAVIPSLVDVMSGIGFACVIIYGGYEIISGAKTVGQFMAFFSALGLAFEPLRRLAGISGLINAASVSIQRMRDIFNHQPTLLGPDNPKPVQPFGDIEFKNVSFRCPNAGLNSPLQHGATAPLANNLSKPQRELRRIIHKTIAKVSDDIERRQTFNTAIAAIMELTNALQKASVDTDNDRSVIREGIEALILMLTPVTPHICHVLWQALGHSDVHNAPWPTADAEAMIEDEKLIIVQVNGKLRAKITVAADAAQADVEQIAMAEGNVQSFVDGKTIRKVIFVPGKLLNIVAN